MCQAKEKEGWFNPGQYDNEANPLAHYKWTAPQIWSQLQEQINVVVSTLGTTGTVYGLGKFFKEKNENIKIVGIARALNNPIPGPRTKSLLAEIAFPWKDYIAEIFEGDTKNSYYLSMQLSRLGLMVGPSSGLSLLGVYKYLDSLNEYERKNLNVVFVCPDSPLPYIEEYFDILGEENFPQIENEELLNFNNNKKEVPVHVKTNNTEVKEISTEDVFSEYFLGQNSDFIWNKLNKNLPVEIFKEILILDVRKEEKFFDHHIPGAKNVFVGDLEKYLEKNLEEIKTYRKIYCVCNFGNSSKTAVEILSSKGIDSFSVQGGMADWSEKNLPRIKPKGCKIKFI
jgi:cysteine synthase A